MACNGSKWYYHFIKNDSSKSVLDDYTLSELSNYFVVYLNAYNYKGNNKKIYTVFTDYLEFRKYISKYECKYWDYHEVIIDKMQKPRFDIDIDMDEYDINEYDIEVIKDLLIDSIIKVFNDYNLSINLQKDILIFTSHGQSKKSMHIIIDNYCHFDHKQALLFYKKVMENIPEKYHNPIIDNSIYKSLQLFRLPRCQKYNSDRPKQLNNVWKYNDTVINYIYKSDIIYNDIHRFNLELESASITYTNNCKILPIIEDDSIDDETTINYSIDIDEDILDKIMEVAINYEKEKNGLDCLPYTYEKIVNNMIILKRICPSYCNICNRIHDNQNPYIFIIDDINTNKKNIYYNCRRSDKNKNDYMGSIENNDINNISDTDNTITNNKINNNIKNIYMPVPKLEYNEYIEKLNSRDLYNNSDFIKKNDNI